MPDEHYWINYETWNVSLWLSNDEGIYTEVRECVRCIIEEKAPWADVDHDGAVYKVSGWLKLFVEDLAELTCPGVIEGASFVADIFGAALGQVDWVEIAEHLMSELEESA